MAGRLRICAGRMDKSVEFTARRRWNHIGLNTQIEGHSTSTSPVASNQATGIPSQDLTLIYQ
jgi:hypothetical protein